MSRHSNLYKNVARFIAETRQGLPPNYTGSKDALRVVSLVLSESAGEALECESQHARFVGIDNFKYDAKLERGWYLLLSDGTQRKPNQ